MNPLYKPRELFDFVDYWGEKLISKYCCLVGYGTLITGETYKKKRNIRVCFIPNYRRLFPKEISWFPFVLPDSKYKGFFALSFDVNDKELRDIDYYEGVFSGLYYRKEIKIVFKEKIEKNAFIYLPTQKTIDDHKLSLKMDPNDLWIDEIKKKKEILKEFPELEWSPKDLERFFLN
jgi:Gamma-glutamyl cyclotransferase, AIG2-like